MLVTKTDFAPYVELPSNLPDAKLNPKINEAETFDLCGLMGFDFYNAFIADNSSQPYTDLLNGATYTKTINGVDVPITFEGLKPVICLFAYSRLILVIDTHLTPNAVMNKRNDFSDHADEKQIGRQVTGYQNNALAYWQKCVNFIVNSGREDFPLWADFGCSYRGDTRPRQRLTGVVGRGNNYPGWSY